MATEIECKMSIDPKAVTDVYRRIVSFVPKEAKHDRVDKKDLYWGVDQQEQALFRVRESQEGLIITRKSKEERTDGLEVNQEIEFSVEPGDREVHAFFSSLGFIPLYRKEKQGWVWSMDNLTIELVEVSTLGWFLEMEILLDTHDGLSTDNALEELMRVRSALQLDHLPLEGRYYSEMLKEHREGAYELWK